VLDDADVVGLRRGHLPQMIPAEASLRTIDQKQQRSARPSYIDRASSRCCCPLDQVGRDRRIAAAGRGRRRLDSSKSGGPASFRPDHLGLVSPQRVLDRETHAFSNHTSRPLLNFAGRVLTQLSRPARGRRQSPLRRPHSFSRINRSIKTSLQQNPRWAVWGIERPPAALLVISIHRNRAGTWPLN
jgi:hypothetical protein